MSAGSKYTWSDEQQLESSVAASRMSAEVSRQLSGMEHYSAASRRDAAIAELIATAPRYPVLAGEDGVTDSTYQWGDPKRFGADETGVVDSTAALKACFDWALPRGRPVVLQGDYLVSGPITTTLSQTSGGAHIQCNGRVTITVDSGGAYFYDPLFYFFTTGTNSVTFAGGELDIDLNNKCRRAFTLANAGQVGGVNFAGLGGVLDMSTPITVRNVYASDVDPPASYNKTAYGFLIQGVWEKIILNAPTVDTVTRAASLDGTGVCGGIVLSDVKGEITIVNPRLLNILNGTQDADGINIAGVPVDSADQTTSRKQGRVVIYNPYFEDCQGRSLKSQCSDVTVFRPKVKRQAYVTISSGHDFDFQHGNGILIEPEFEYVKNSGVSPLGASFSPVVFQNRLKEIPMASVIRGGRMMTDVAMGSFCDVLGHASALDARVEIDGLVVQATGDLLTAATTAFTRNLVEFDASKVEASSNKTRFAIRNFRGPCSLPLLGYTGYGGGDITEKLSFELEGNVNTVTTAADRAFSAASGTAITSVKRYRLLNNSGFYHQMAGAWVVDLTNRVPMAGSDFYVDLSVATFTNGPTSAQGLPASGIARVTIGNYRTATTVPVEVRVAGDALVFYLDSASTWKRRKITGSATYDPANLVDGAGATTTVTCTGAVLGDFAEASFSLDLQGITLTAWVSAADTVSVRFQNETGGAIDLGSGTLRVEVREP